MNFFEWFVCVWMVVASACLIWFYMYIKDMATVVNMNVDLTAEIARGLVEMHNATIKSIKEGVPATVEAQAPPQTSTESFNTRI